MDADKERQERRLLLVDTDGGLDDAMALFMLLNAHQNPTNGIKLVAITCVFGNTSLNNVTRNVTRVLQTADEEKIPVYAGAECAITTPYVRSYNQNPFHGADGFGDGSAGLPEIEPKVEKDGAVAAILSLVHQYEGELSVLALGTLTNLAIAIRSKPEISDKLKELVILGGNHQGRGNLTLCAEFNFAKDAEAARIVLDTFKCPITIIPIETFEMSNSVRFRKIRDEKLGVVNSPAMNLMNKLEEKNLQRMDTWYSADSVAAGIFLEPKVVTQIEEHFCTVELSGEFTRGMMIVDKKNELQMKPNVKIVTEIDLDLYEQVLLKSMGQGSMTE